MKSAGFTLIELLLVVVIVGIMSYMGINIINSQSIERKIINEAAILEAQIKFICDASILENRAHGIEWIEGSIQLLKHQAGDWVPLAMEPPIFDTEQVVFLNGLQQVLETETEELPHVICQTDGSFNAFEVQWPIVGSSENKPHYSLKTESPYQLAGSWVE